MSLITELVTRVLSSLGITGDTPTGTPGNAGPGGGGGGGAVGSPDQKPGGSLGGALGAGLGGLLGDSLGENLPAGLGSDLAGSLTGGLGGLAGGLGNLGGLTDGLGDLGGLAGGLGGQLDDLQGVVEDLTGRVEDLEQPGQGADPEQAGGVDPAGDQPAALPTGGDQPTDPGDGDRPDMGGPANPQTWMSAALASGDHRGLDVQSGGWRPQPLTYGPPQGPDQPQAWQPGTWLGADPTTGPGGYLGELTRAVMTAAHTTGQFPPARLPGGPAGGPAPALAGGNGGSGGPGGTGGGWRGGDTPVTGHDQPTTTLTSGGADLNGTHAATAHQDRMDWLAAAHGFHDPHTPTATSNGPTGTGGQARLVGNGMAVPTRDGDTLTLTPTTTSPHARTSPDLARGRYLIHIDNAAAPGSYDFALDMPTGAHAVENHDGSVGIIGTGGDTIQTIAAPWAKDAHGHDLPTRFQVSTGPDGTTTLTQHVAFDDTTAFPVLADPAPEAAPAGDEPADAAPDTGGTTAEDAPTEAPTGDTPEGDTEATGAGTDGSTDEPTDTTTDTNGDGNPDTDTNADGAPDVDTNADRVPDVDTNADGVPDTDTNADGIPDTDTNGDGVPDADVDGDGVLDLPTPQTDPNQPAPPVQDPPGNGALPEEPGATPYEPSAPQKFLGWVADTIREKAAGLGKTLTDATDVLRDNPIVAPVLKGLSSVPSPIAPIATIVRDPTLTNGVGELLGGMAVTSANVTERWALPAATLPINPIGQALGNTAAAAGIDPWAEVNADYTRDPVGTAIEDASVALSAIPIPGVGAAASAATRPLIAAGAKALAPIAGKISDWGRKLFKGKSKVESGGRAPNPAAGGSPPTGGATQRPVLLDTSAVRAQTAAQGLLKPGECAAVCPTIQQEAAAKGFGAAADGLPVVPDGVSAVLRGKVATQLRGFGAATRGLENDATIGATALERGIPLVTGDRALWNAVIKLGGIARWFAPGG